MAYNRYLSPKAASDRVGRTEVEANKSERFLGGRMSSTRERIVTHVTRVPGIHVRGLTRDLGLAPGQVQYHLRRLQGDGTVVAERVGGRRHFFPPAYGERERLALATLRRETARDVLTRLLRSGPARPGTVAADLDIARSTLEWHLDRLSEAELVAKRRDEAGRVTLVLADAELVAALLEDVEPTLPERLVGRFTRLVDGLLTE